MKILITFFCSCFCSLLVFADPIEHLTYSQATGLARKLKQDRFFVKHCDCCEESSAILIEVAEAEVIPCWYSEGMYSVEVTGTSIIGFSAGFGPRLFTEATLEDPFKGILSLNYSWGLADETGKLLPFGFITDYWTEHQCTGFLVLPSISRDDQLDIPANYSEWLNRRITGPLVLDFPGKGGIFRFKGTINKKYPITMDLDISPYGDIYGSYQYDKVGTSIELEGGFNEFGGFSLSERVENETTGYFYGSHFDPKTLTGTWESADGNK
ncbi:MAG: hypothetical protein AAF598_14320, partial [Bacteroidota bacterium]